MLVWISRIMILVIGILILIAISKIQRLIYIEKRIKKYCVVDEKDDTICFTLPELIPQRDDITTPTFWLNKRNVKESPLNGNYYQLKIYADKEKVDY